MRLLILVFVAVWTPVGSTFAADREPLKIFLLVGQSNMQGHADVRTFEHVGMDSRTAGLLAEMQGEDGKATVCQDVWISSLSSDGEKHGRLTAGFGANQDKIGPEFTFGISMEKSLKQPILLIKTAWGGKSLHTDFRSPGAGPYVFNEGELENFRKQGKDLEAMVAEKESATGKYYGLMIDHVKRVLADIPRVYPNYDPKAGYELAGFVWFQGWNDMVDQGVYPQRDQAGGYDAYSETLTHFIRDVRHDLSAPDLPFVIGVMGVGGPVAEYGPDQKRYAPIHQNFRDAMAAPAKLPEFKGNVTAVLTEAYWDRELVDLRAREGKINQEMKALASREKLSREEQQAAQERLRAEAFTPRERETLQKGVSNAEFHYLGSAKIMAQIGQGFAQALLDMEINTGG